MKSLLNFEGSGTKLFSCSIRIINRNEQLYIFFLLKDDEGRTTDVTTCKSALNKLTADRSATQVNRTP